jgi:O-antigen ligase
MFFRQAMNRIPWLTLGYGLAAVGLGAVLGYAVVRLDNPLIAVAGLFGGMAALICVLNVEIGVMALVGITFIRLSDVLVNFYHLPSIAKPFIALLLVGVVLRWIFHSSPPRGWTRAVLLIGLFGVVVFLSLIYADNFDNSYNALTDFLKDAVIGIILVVVLQREQIFRWTIYALLAAGIFMGALSIFQYLTGTYTNHYWGFANATLMNIVGESSSYRISGPYGSPNVYAQIMVAMVPLSLERVLSERNPLLRVVALVALVISVLTVIFTFSRSGFLALAFVILFFMTWRRTQFSTWIILAAIGLGMLSMLPQQYTERLSTLTSLFSDENAAQSEVSFRGRASEATIGWRMFLDHPILGVGKENYPVRYQDYSRKLGLDPRSENRSPHSLYVEIAAEQGLVGLFVFGLLIYNIFIGLSQARKTFEMLGEPQMASMAMGMTITMAGYLTSAIFVHSSYPRPFWVLVGLALAYPVYARARFESTRLEKKRG